MSSPFDVGKEFSSEQLDAFVQKDYAVNIGTYFSQGWSLFSRNAGNFIGFTALTWMIAFATAFAGQLISAPLAAGYFVVIFMMIKDERVEFGDFFKGFNYFLPIVISAILMGIFIAVGIVFFILPGIYLSVGYLFVTMFIVDKGMYFWQAMETSRKIVTKRWWSLFGLILLLGLLNLVGALMLFVGLLVTVPWSVCILASAYADIVGLETDAAASPPLSVE